MRLPACSQVTTKLRVSSIISVPQTSVPLQRIGQCRTEALKPRAQSRIALEWRQAGPFESSDHGRFVPTAIVRRLPLRRRHVADLWTISKTAIASPLLCTPPLPPSSPPLSRPFPVSSRSPLGAAALSGLFSGIPLHRPAASGVIHDDLNEIGRTGIMPRQHTLSLRRKWPIEIVWSTGNRGTW